MISRQSKETMKVLQYYYRPNVRPNAKVFPFVVWDGLTGSQSNRIVAFAVTEESAKSLVHQLNTVGYVED